MHIPKEYFHDKAALALSGLSLLIVLLTIITLLVRLSLGSGNSYIVGYRANLGIEAFQSGSPTAVVLFIVFSLVIFTAQTLLCWRVFLIQRRLAIGILASGAFLLLLALITSNALLALH